MKKLDNLGKSIATIVGIEIGLYDIFSNTTINPDGIVITINNWKNRKINIQFCKLNSDKLPGNFLFWFVNL